jgi:hypothetical protein
MINASFAGSVGIGGLRRPMPADLTFCKTAVKQDGAGLRL